MSVTVVLSGFVFKVVCYILSLYLNDLEMIFLQSAGITNDGRMHAMDAHAFQFNDDSSNRLTIGCTIFQHIQHFVAFHK